MSVGFSHNFLLLLPKFVKTSNNIYLISEGKEIDIYYDWCCTLLFIFVIIYHKKGELGRRNTPVPLYRNSLEQCFTNRDREIFIIFLNIIVNRY